MRGFLERGIPLRRLVAFNDVIALGATARGAAHSAARTRAAWPALSPALDPDKARFGSQSAAMTARSDQTKPSAQTVMTLTAVASGRAKTECSAVVFDTGAGCRRNRDGVPYAVRVADRRWSCACSVSRATSRSRCCFHRSAAASSWCPPVGRGSWGSMPRAARHTAMSPMSLVLGWLPGGAQTG
jgi:hypothetical protein